MRKHTHNSQPPVPNFAKICVRGARGPLGLDPRDPRPPWARAAGLLQSKVEKPTTPVGLLQSKARKLTAPVGLLQSKVRKRVLGAAAGPRARRARGRGGGRGAGAAARKKAPGGAKKAPGGGKKGRRCGAGKRASYIARGGRDVSKTTQKRRC